MIEQKIISALLFFFLLANNQGTPNVSLKDNVLGAATTSYVYIIRNKLPIPEKPTIPPTATSFPTATPLPTNTPIPPTPTTKQFPGDIPIGDMSVQEVQEDTPTPTKKPGGDRYTKHTPTPSPEPSIIINDVVEDPPTSTPIPPAQTYDPISGAYLSPTPKVNTWGGVPTIKPTAILPTARPTDSPYQNNPTTATEPTKTYEPTAPPINPTPPSNTLSPTPTIDPCLNPNVKLEKGDICIPQSPQSPSSPQLPNSNSPTPIPNPTIIKAKDVLAIEIKPATSTESQSSSKQTTKTESQTTSNSSTSNMNISIEGKSGSSIQIQQEEFVVQKGYHILSITQTNQGSSTLTLESNDTKATLSMPLTIDPSTNIMMVQTPNGPKRVTIMPDEAFGILGELKVIDTDKQPAEVVLEEKNGQLQYKILAKKSKKLLGIIPIKLQKEASITADTGAIIEVTQPFFDSILNMFVF